MMKKLLLFSCLVLGVSLSYAGALNEIVNMNSSSFTTSNDTTKFIKTRPGDIFVGVILSSGMPLTSGITIYDSSATATNQIGFISGYSVSQNPGQFQYNVRLSSGLTYSTVGNAGGWTILYKRTRSD